MNKISKKNAAAVIAEMKEENEKNITVFREGPRVKVYVGADASGIMHEFSEVPTIEELQEKVRDAFDADLNP